MDRLEYHPAPGRILDIINIGTLRFDPLHFDLKAWNQDYYVHEYIQTIYYQDPADISLLFQIRRLKRNFITFFIFETGGLIQFKSIEEFFLKIEKWKVYEFTSFLLSFMDHMKHLPAYYLDFIRKKQSEKIVEVINAIEDLTEGEKRKLLSICFAPGPFLRKLYIAIMKYAQMRDICEKLFPDYFADIIYTQHTLPKNNFDFADNQIIYSTSYIDDMIYYHQPDYAQSKSYLVIGKNFGCQKAEPDPFSFSNIFSNKSAWNIINLLHTREYTIKDLAEKLKVEEVVLEKLIEKMLKETAIKTKMVNCKALLQLNKEYFRTIGEYMLQLGDVQKKYFIINSENTENL